MISGDFFVGLLAVDPLNLYKFLAPVGAGIFAAFGLLTQYRDPKTQKITVAGRVAVAGVLLSALIAAGASALQSDKERKEDLAFRATQIAQYEQIKIQDKILQTQIANLALEKEQLQQLARTTSPLLAPTIKLSLLIPNASWDKFRKDVSIPTNVAQPYQFKVSDVASRITVRIPRLPDKGSSRDIEDYRPAIGWVADKASDGKISITKSFTAYSADVDFSGARKESDGSIVSWRDLNNRNVVLECLSYSSFCSAIYLDNLEIQDVSGRRVNIHLKCTRKENFRPASSYLLIICPIGLG